MAGVETFVNLLNQQGIVAEIWIDGSFLTQKIDAEDADIVVSIKEEDWQKATPQQRQVLNGINQIDLKAQFHCDAYAIITEYPDGHPLQGEGEWTRAYWIKQFGFSRGHNPQRQSERKGMILVSLPLPKQP